MEPLDQVEDASAVGQPAVQRGRQVLNVSVADNPGSCRRPRHRVTERRQVCRGGIDDDLMLGAILRARQQFLGKPLVLRR
jgi:hypothetical protein